MDQLDRPRDYHTKLDKDEYMISLICGIKNMTQIKTYLQKRNRLTDLEQTWLLEGKGVGGRINQKFGISSYKLLYIK